MEWGEHVRERERQEQQRRIQRQTGQFAGNGWMAGTADFLVIVYFGFKILMGIAGLVALWFSFQFMRASLKGLSMPNATQQRTQQAFRQPESVYDGQQDIQGIQEYKPTETRAGADNIANGKALRPVINLYVPKYPEHLLKQGIEGTVTFKAFYDRMGNFMNAKVIETSGRGEFDDAAFKVISHSALLNMYGLDGEASLIITCGFKYGLASCRY